MKHPPKIYLKPEFAPAGKSLFRFLSTNTSHFKSALEKLVARNEIYLSSRRGFNDPFDMNPILKADWTTAAIRQHIKNIVANPYRSQATPETIAKFVMVGTTPPKEIISTRSIREMKRKFPLQMKQLLDKMGVCCFTEEMQNPLFWAHYAASYSGICIEVRATGDTSHPFCNLMKVRYAEARPIVYGTQTGAFPTVYTKHNWDYVAQYGLCTKSSDWAVEKEWRLWIVERSDSYQPLPPKTLRSIFLGPSIGHEAASFVLEAVKTHQTRVKVFRTALSATDFRVEIGARIH